MKKFVSALAILVCLIGGMWLVYGSVVSEPDTSQATSNPPSPSDLKPFESDQALEQVADRESSDDESGRGSDASAAEGAQARREPNPSDESASTEASNDEQTPVDSEAVVLNVERDEPSEPASNESSSSGSSETEPPSPEQPNGSDLPPPEVRAKLTELASDSDDTERNNLGRGNGSNALQLSEDVRQHLLQGADLQQPTNNALPDGVDQLSKDQLSDDLPSRNR